jgi:hypothetical protein
LGESAGTPTVLREGPYRFFFVSVDFHEPPRVHVRREDKVARFWLDPVILQKAGGFSRYELDRIARLVDEHKEHLLESWYDFFGS